MEKVSRAVEDHLKMLYKLAEKQREEGLDKGVASSEMAQRLGVSPASISKTLKKLAEKGLVVHEPYYGAQLTETGRQIAVNLIRKHRILETYLVEKLGYGWDEVDAEAEVLEHAMSEKLTRQMWEALGKPSHDPHGSPIPSEGCDWPEIDWMPLSEVEVGSEVEVVRIRNSSPEVLRELQEAGVTIGEQVALIQKNAEGWLIKGQNKEVPLVVSKQLAENIGVKRDTQDG